MSRTVPFVHSAYPRAAGDHYPTIDRRVVYALLETWPVSGNIVDVCAPSGSGIIFYLTDLNYSASGIANAFAPVEADWIVTNPPYKRSLVDKIVGAQIERVRRGEVHGFASLMRSGWDFAGGKHSPRPGFFDSNLYAGQTKMRFRPYWTAENVAEPIHQFVWHVWQKPTDAEPVVRYWPRGESYVALA